MIEGRQFRFGRRGLLAHMVALVLVVLAPALGLGAVTTLVLAESYRAAFETQLTAVARSIAASLDEALNAHLALGRSLASSGSLRRGDFLAFDEEARAAAEALGTWVSVTNPGPEYRRVVNTALPPGQRPDYGGLVLPPEQAPIPRVFATGEPRVTNVGMSIALHRPTALVLVPVVRDGAVAHVLGLGFEPGRVERLLRAQALSAELVATVVDGRGRVIASSHRHGEVAGRMAPEWLVQGAGRAGTPLRHGRLEDGEAALAAVLPLIPDS